MNALLAAMPGAMVAVAVLLAVAGVYGTRPRLTPRSQSHVRARWSRLAGRVRPRALAVAVVSGVVVGMLTGWPVAAIAVAAGIVAIPQILTQPGNRDLITTLDGLAEWTRRIADILASGAGGLEQAITASARTAPAALAEPVTALSVRIRTRGLESALWAFAEEVDHPATHRIVASLILRTRAGGRGLIDILDGLATSLRAESGMRRQVEADRAKSRTSARALVGIVAAVTVGLIAFTYDYLTPFATLTGQLWMTVVAAIFATGLGWLAMLTRPPREPGWLFDTRTPIRETRS